MNPRATGIAWMLVASSVACDPREVDLVPRDGGSQPDDGAPVVRNRGLNDELIAAFARDNADRTDPALAIVYPSTGTVIPNNLTHMHYQWRAPEALDSFEIRIEGERGEARYYTHDRDFRDGVESSKLLARRHSGQRVRIRVRALARRSPSIVYRSEAVTLDVAPSGSRDRRSTGRPRRAASSAEICRPDTRRASLPIRRDPMRRPAPDVTRSRATGSGSQSRTATIDSRCSQRRQGHSDSCRERTHLRSPPTPAKLRSP